jgi:ABC-type multidrug transport system fused ATPase/permease subunit
VEEVSRGRTLLVITHRLVRMEGFDEILVLDGGRVVERGTHAGLAAADGPYARMLAVQREMLAAA